MVKPAGPRQQAGGANGVCERCGATVTKKNLRQWMLKITAYAERLLEDLNKLDWPEKVKKMQSDWIGKSYGAEVEFAVKDTVIFPPTLSRPGLPGMSLLCCGR